MNTPRFSVVIAAYNAQRTIAETLDSALAQALDVEQPTVVVSSVVLPGSFLDYVIRELSAVQIR